MASCVRLAFALAVLLFGVSACEDSGGDSPGIPGSYSIPANLEEGVLITAPAKGTYAFTITGGSYSFYAKIEEWLSRLVAYKNRPVTFGGNASDTSPQRPDYRLGKHIPQPTPEAAENVGIGARITVSLDEGEYLRLLVPESQGFFGDNRGHVTVYVEQVP